MSDVTILGEVWEADADSGDPVIWAGWVECECSDDNEVGLHIKARVGGVSEGTRMASIYLSESTARALALEIITAADESAPSIPSDKQVQ